MFVEPSVRLSLNKPGCLLFGTTTAGSSICDRKYTDAKRENIAPAKTIAKPRKIFPVRACNIPPATKDRTKETKLPTRLRTEK